MNGYSGRVSITQEPNGNLQGVNWGEKLPTSPLPTSTVSTPLINPYVKDEWSILAEGSTPLMEKLKSTDVDANGLPVLEVENDWITYSSATPYPPRSSFTAMRKRVTTPWSTQAYDTATGAVPLNLVKAVEVQDSAGVVKSRSQYSYTTAGNLEYEYRWDSKKAAAPLTTGTNLTTANAVQVQYNVYGTRKYHIVPGCAEQRDDLYLAKDI